MGPERLKEIICGNCLDASARDYLWQSLRVAYRDDLLSECGVPRPARHRERPIRTLIELDESKVRLIEIDIVLARQMNVLRQKNATACLLLGIPERRRIGRAGCRVIETAGCLVGEDRQQKLDRENTNDRNETLFVEELGNERRRGELQCE